MSPTSAGGGANIITGGEHISPASLKRQEEVLPTAKLEQRRYKSVQVKAALTVFHVKHCQGCLCLEADSA